MLSGGPVSLTLGINESPILHMPTVHLVEGPVGAGKSTYSTLLAQQINGVHIALDAWFVALFSPDRPETDIIPWYLERKDRLLDIIWIHSQRILATGTDVILELGLIQRQARTAFCHRVQSEGFEPLVHVLDAPLDIRRQRVQHRNIEKGATFSMIVSDHVFDIANKMWEAPDDMECAEYQVNFPSEPANNQRDA